MDGMRRAGKVSLPILIAIVGVVALVFLVFFAKEGPAAAGSRFMDALARGDVDTLTKTSYADGKSPEDLRKEWEFATKVAGQHYRFKWGIVSSSVTSEDSAVVRLQVQKNYGPGSYDENFGLTLRKIKNEWKVDPTGISPEMYPALPRAGKTL